MTRIYKLVLVFFYEPMLYLIQAKQGTQKTRAHSSEGYANMTNFLNVYEVTREFGGHEEGGWYYDNFTLIHTRETQESFTAEQLEDIETVFTQAGFKDVRAYTEDTEGEMVTLEAPEWC